MASGAMDSLRDAQVSGDNGGAGQGGLVETQAPTSTATTEASQQTSSAAGGGTGVTDGGDSDNGTGSGQGSTESVITFDASNFNGDTRVFRAGDLTKTFAYSANSSVVFTDVKWLGKSKDTGDFQEFARAEFNDGEDTASVEKGFGEVTDKGAELNLTILSTDGSLNKWLGKEMQLQIDWETNLAKGNSLSGLFSVVDANTAPAAAQREIDASISADPELGTGGDQDITYNNSPSATNGATPSSTNAPNKSSKGGGGGLSTGATAGIAVGAVIGGLLIIGALAWFFLRRRRQNKDLKTYTEQPSNTFMVDKETPHRNTDSPNSPYSDENGGQRERVPLEDITVARNTSTRNTDRPRSFTPYDDAAPRTSTGSHAGRGSNSGTHTPQGVSTNVAHLVEDGMTADEIRRLEEEERQLDDEIERAGRR